MNSADKQAVLHCLKSMIDEEVCEECPLYGTIGTDHCEKDCVRLAINALSRSEKPNKWIGAEVLDKIRAEIDRQEKWLLQAGYNAYNVDIAFDAIKSAVAESEDKE